jgi:hypothetical protein
LKFIVQSAAQRTLKAKTHVVTTEQNNLHSKGLYILYCAPNMINIIKTNWMGRRI